MRHILYAREQEELYRGRKIKGEDTVEKPKEKYGSLEGILFIFASVCREDRALLLFSTVRIPALVLLPLCSIYLPKLVIDEVSSGQTPLHVLAAVGLLTLAMVVFNILLEQTQARIQVHSNQYYVRLRAKISEKMVDTDYANIESHEGQVKREKAIMRNYSSDNVGVEMIVTSAVNVAANLLGFVAYSGILLTLSPWVLVLLVGITALNYVFLRYLNRYELKNLQQRAEYERQMDYIHNNINLQSGKDIRLYKMKKWLDDRYMSAIRGRERLTHSFVVRLYMGSTLEKTLALVRDAVIYLYLIYLVLGGRIAVSDFVLYLGAVAGFSTWISQLIKAFCRSPSGRMSPCPWPPAAE